MQKVKKQKVINELDCELYRLEKIVNDLEYNVKRLKYDVLYKEQIYNEYLKTLKD